MSLHPFTPLAGSPVGCVMPQEELHIFSWFQSSAFQPTLALFPHTALRVTLTSDNGPRSSRGVVFTLQLQSPACLNPVSHLLQKLSPIFHQPVTSLLYTPTALSRKSFVTQFGQSSPPLPHAPPLCLPVPKAWFLIKPSNCEVKSQFHAPYSWWRGSRLLTCLLWSMFSLVPSSGSHRAEIHQRWHV